MTQQEQEKREKQIAEFGTYDKKFRYMLLSRMQSDCEYFLGYGNRHEKFLWGLNVASHIAYMLALWDMFGKDEKPEWLSREKIKDYSRQMGNLETVQ